MRSKGEGSIFKTDKGYRGYVTVNGKRKYFTAPSKALAAQKLRQLTNQRDTTGLATGRVDTVGEWIDHWIQITEQKHKPKTHDGYKYAVSHYLSSDFKRVRLSKLTAERIEVEYDRLSEAGYAGATRHQVHSIVRASLKLAQQRGHIANNPAANVTNKPIAARRTVTAISDADVAAIKTEVDKLRLKARWHIAFGQGVRPAEVIGLEWPQVDTAARTITFGQQLHYIDKIPVIVDDAKSKAGERTLPLPEYLADMLDEWRAQQLAEYALHQVEPWSPDDTPRSWVFTSSRHPGRPLTDSGDSSAWRRLLVRAGVPHTRRYATRHTAASFLIANGVDVATVAAVLGHKDPGFTLRTYVHTVEERMLAVATLLDAHEIASR